MTKDVKMAGLKQYMIRKTDALASESTFDALGLEAGKSQTKVLSRHDEMAKLRLSLMYKPEAKSDKARFFEANFPPFQAQKVKEQAFASEVLFDTLALESTFHKKQQRKQKRIAARAAKAEEDAAAAAFAKLKASQQPAYIVLASNRSHAAFGCEGFLSAATTQDTL